MRGSRAPPRPGPASPSRPPSGTPSVWYSQAANHLRRFPRDPKSRACAAPAGSAARKEGRGEARVILRRRRLGAGSHGGRARGAVHPCALWRVGARSFVLRVRPLRGAGRGAARAALFWRVGLGGGRGRASPGPQPFVTPWSGLLAAFPGLEPRQRQVGSACSSSATGVRVGAWPWPRPPKRSPALVLPGAVPTPRLFQGPVPHRPPGSRLKFVNK